MDATEITFEKRAASFFVSSTAGLFAKNALLKYETIDADQIDDLMNRREVRAPAKHDDKSSAGPDDNENKSEDKTSENDNSSENAQKTLENDDVTTDSEDKSQDSSEKEDK